MQNLRAEFQDMKNINTGGTHTDLFACISRGDEKISEKKKLAKGDNIFGMPDGSLKVDQFIEDRGGWKLEKEERLKEK